MNEKISVVIPAYDIEAHLANCLNSVLTQTYKNIEVIVVDDGSKDGTGAIIDQYAQKDNRVKAIHKENGGVTSARFTGIEFATGDWIGFVDGDDYIEIDMYELLLRNAKKYNAKISHCGFQMVFKDGYTNSFYNTGTVLEMDTKEGIRALLEGTRIEPSLCNKLFHKSLFVHLLHNDCMPRVIKNNEDLLMNYYLFKETEKSIWEDKCKYHYLIREDSASRQAFNAHKIFDPIKVKEIILNECDGEIKESAKKAYLSTCIYTYSELTLGKVGRYSEEKKKIRSYIKGHKDGIAFLPGKTRILGQIILFAPLVAHVIYPIYAKTIRKKRYEQ